MLTIRKDQMRAMAGPMLAYFENQLAEHVATDFPDQAESLGKDKVREAVHYGVTKALDYGLETEQDMSRYVYLMFTFGRDFDKDPELPWAGETLRAKASSERRMERLYEEAAPFEDVAGGLNGGATGVTE